MRVLWSALHQDTCKLLDEWELSGGDHGACFLIELRETERAPTQLVECYVTCTDRVAPDGAKRMAYIHRLEPYDGDPEPLVVRAVSRVDLPVQDRLSPSYGPTSEGG